MELRKINDIVKALRREKNFTLAKDVQVLNFQDYHFDENEVAQLAEVLKSNDSVHTLAIETNTEGAESLIEALKSNITLTRLEFIGLSSLINSYGYGDEPKPWRSIKKRVADLTQKNKEQQNVIRQKVQYELTKLRQDLVKEAVENYRRELQKEEQARRQQEADLLASQRAKELQQQAEAEKLKEQRALEARKLREEKIAKRQSNLKAWIDKSDWEAVAAFIKANPGYAITNLLIAGKYNLNTTTFVNELSARTVQKRLEELQEDIADLSKTTDELTNVSKTLEQQLIELKEKTQQVEAEMKRVNEEAIDTEKTLDIKEKKISAARANLEHIQKALAESTPKLQRWKERLQTNLQEWTEQDVEFLLREIDMTSYTSVFIKNKIDGGVLLDLTTSDLIDTLGLTFKEAKRLLKSVFLARMCKDIYSTPPGVLQWPVDTVCSWLEEKKFAHLTDIFCKQQITGSELVFIDRSDLKKYLGIEALGDCVKLEKVIRELRQTHLSEESIQRQMRVGVDETEKSELENKLSEIKKSNDVKDSKKNAPEAFCCPITQEVMSDPVVASDGHAYERAAIEDWLLTHDTSPMTNQRLENKVLTPSHTLKSLIREFVERK